MRKGTTTLMAVMLGVLAVSCTRDDLIEGPTAPGGTDLALLQGHAYAVDGGDMSGLWAMWRPAGESVVDSVQVAADGTFAMQTTPRPETAGDADHRRPEPRRFEPFQYPFRRSSQLLNVDVVLIPRTVDDPRGIYRARPSTRAWTRWWTTMRPRPCTRTTSDRRTPSRIPSATSWT